LGGTSGKCEAVVPRIQHKFDLVISLMGIVAICLESLEERKLEMPWFIHAAKCGFLKKCKVNYTVLGKM
jgi:hypothetical protein